MLNSFLERSCTTTPMVDLSQLALAFSKVGAVFTHARDGGALRRHVGKAQHKPNGLFSSVKAGRSMVFEAMHQRDLIWIWEADPQVVDFASEPLRIDLITTAGPMTYFADALCLKANGELEIVETKKTRDEVTRDPAYAKKLELVDDACGKAGFKFSILDHQEIRRGWRLSNARAIAIDRTASVGTLDKMRLIETIENNGGSIAYGEAAASLSAFDNPYDAAARARLHSLIVRRFLTINIEKRIDLFTPLALCKPADETLANVFAHRRRH